MLMDCISKIDGLTLSLIKKQFPAEEDLKMQKLEWFLYLTVTEHLSYNQLQRLVDKLENIDTNEPISKSPMTNEEMTKIVKNLVAELTK